MLKRIALLATLGLVLIAATWLIVSRWQHYSPSKAEILTPGPLRGPLEQLIGPAALTRQGIFEATNTERQAHTVSALTLNNALNQAAEAKVNDMFARQYFEHVGPDGKGPADWVTAAHYQYLRVGENLALGNFASDTALVAAWMDSPGHRANILSPGFTEIGIAVRKGTFEGHSTWLAVQTFARPASACPPPDSTLHTDIEMKKTAAETQKAELTALLEEIAIASEKIDVTLQEIEQLANEGRQKIAEGNAEIERGNEIYKETGSRDSAQPYWDRGHELQEEGTALLEEAQKKQDATSAEQNALNTMRTSYNNKLGHLKTLEKTLQTLIDRYNDQVNTYNACLN